MEDSSLIIFTGLTALLCVFFGIVIWILSLRRVVPTDQVHILQRGSDTLSYGKKLLDKFVSKKDTTEQA